MKTPKDKYLNDPEYHHLVDMLESFIDRAMFTPSELREACIFASINYEMRHVREFGQNPEIMHALNTLDDFVNRKSGRNRG